MRIFYRENKDSIDKLLIVVFFVAIMFVFFNYVFSYVSPFVFGLVLSVMLTPLAKLLNKYLHISKGFSAFLSIVILIVLLASLSNILFSRILIEGRSFLENMPETIVYVQDTIKNINLHYHNMFNLFPEEWGELLNKLGNDFASSLTSSVGNLLKTGSTAVVSKVPNFILGFMLSLLSCFFFIKDRALILKSISKVMPATLKRYIVLLKSGIIDALLGYVKAQAILMSIVAVICFIGMAILKVEYALFLCLLVAFIDALPVFGSGFVYWPWIVFSLLSGDYKMAIGLGIIYITVLFTRQILEPKILGTQIGIHPLITLMSIYVGLRLFGVFGIFIGPCIVVIIKTILTSSVHEEAINVSPK